MAKTQKAATTNLTCKHCGNTFSGAYCNACGEKAHHEHDKSVVHLFEEAFHFIIHFEGKFFTTLRTVFTAPGKMSTDYCNGIRKKYFKPISFFLLLVILYLLFPVFEGLNMKLYYHVHHNIYGKYAMQLTEKVMATKKLDEETIAMLFNTKGEKTSKFLLFVLIPMMAIVSYIPGRKKRPYYYDHFIFNTEILSFFLLWGFLLLPVLMRGIYWLTGYLILSTELQTAVAGMSVIMAYLAIATRRFLQFAWWQVLLFTIMYSVILALLIEVVYKFILFYTAIHLL